MRNCPLPWGSVIAIRTSDSMRCCVALLILLGISMQASAKTAAAVRLDAGAHATVTIRRGELLEVRLLANITTGFGWEIATMDTSVVAIFGRRNEPTDASSPPQATGGPIIQIFVLKATGVGKTRVNLNHVRQWEKDQPPDKTAQVTIIVTD
jgi:predicted secreted protein